jgi:hypothetical protein
MSSGGGNGMILLVVVIGGVLCSGCCSVMGGGLIIAQNPELRNKLKNMFNFGAPTAPGGKIQDDGTYKSGEIMTGRRGSSKFSASCPSGRFVKRIYMKDRQVGVGVKRHGRVGFLGLMCSDGKDKKVIGTKAQMGTNLECTDGMSSIDSWKTSDAIQQINAYCDDGTNANILGVNDKRANTGSGIGEQVAIRCPDGMRISGVSGTYDIRKDETPPGADAIRSWQWQCSKK